MRTALVILLGMSLSGLGCGDDGDDGDGATGSDGGSGSDDGGTDAGDGSDGGTGTSGDGTGADGTSGGTSGTGGGGDGGDDVPEACTQMQDDARALVDANRDCSGGEACVMVDTPDLLDKQSCLISFGCPTAFVETADVDAFIMAAMELDAAYGEACEFCPDPMCKDPSILEPVCLEEDGMCTLEDMQDP